MATSASPSYPKSTSVSYCYDNADRLTSDAVTGAPSGASELLSTNLVSTGTGTNLTYDSHGDITTLGDEAMTYDQTGRHVSTTTGSTTITYTRDAQDNIIGMSTAILGGATTAVEYSGGGGIQFTLNGSGVFQEEDLSLPGGVTVSIQGTGSSPVEVWSYPDLHGDDTVTADQAGARGSGFAYYDPFGDPEDLTTDLIGTITANGSVPDNTTTDSATNGDASFGWEGSHSKSYQHTDDIATIEMGDRQYVPLLGRFLSVDPIPGGNANDYNYPNDPINDSDLTGHNDGPEVPSFGSALGAGGDAPAPGEAGGDSGDVTIQPLDPASGGDGSSLDAGDDQDWINPLEQATYSDKVLAQEQLGDLHDFPRTLDTLVEEGDVTVEVGGDGQEAIHIRVPGTRTIRGQGGTVRVYSGIYHWIIDAAGNVTHHILEEAVRLMDLD